MKLNIAIFIQGVVHSVFQFLFPMSFISFCFSFRFINMNGIPIPIPIVNTENKENGSVIKYSGIKGFEFFPTIETK